MPETFALLLFGAAQRKSKRALLEQIHGLIKSAASTKFGSKAPNSFFGRRASQPKCLYVTESSAVIFTRPSMSGFRAYNANHTFQNYFHFFQ
jgi:hypothetical protein